MRSVSGAVSRGWQTLGMNNDILLAIRCVFTGLFVLTVLAGVFLVKNHHKLFGVDRNMPSETGSSRAYSRLQVFLVWAHFFVLTGSFALLLH